MQTLLTVLFWAALTHYHKLSGLNNQYLFLTFWRLEGWDEDASMIGFLVSTFFLVYRWPLGLFLKGH